MWKLLKIRTVVFSGLIIQAVFLFVWSEKQPHSFSMPYGKKIIKRNDQMLVLAQWGFNYFLFICL